jgi:hypothetical protein
MSEKQINVGIGLDMSGFSSGLKDAATGLDSLSKNGKTRLETLSSQFRASVKDAEHLALKYGETSEAFKDAANRAGELKNKLAAVHETINAGNTTQSNNVQNIGKVTSGYNGLNMSINQLSRELPAFTYSMQTGFMAISNNIPMLVDELNRLKIANKELAAQGLPVKSSFAQIAGALFSWQTGLSIGITVLTVYGAKLFELAEGLFTADGAIQEIQKHIDQMTISVKNNAEIFEIWNKTYGQGLGGSEAERFKAREQKEATFQELVKKSMAIQEEEQKTGVKNLIGRNMIYLALQQNLETYNKTLAEIDKKEQSKTKKDTKSPFNTDSVKFGLSDVTTATEDLTGLTDVIKEYTTATDIAAASHENFMSALEQTKQVSAMVSQMMESLINTGINGFAQALGRAIAGTGNFADDLLALFGNLAMQAGSALIAIGTAMSLAPGAQGIACGWLAGGAALVTIGSALSANQSSKSYGMSGGSSQPESGYQNRPSMISGSELFARGQQSYLEVAGQVRGNNLKIALINTDNSNRRVK